MVEDSFDAAHALRGYKGPCENLHGHTWKVQLFFRGEKLDQIGILEDFKNIKKELAAALSNYDHNFLNETQDFRDQNPSSENLSQIIYNKMKTKLKGISKVVVWESPTTNAAYWE